MAMKRKAPAGGGNGPIGATPTSAQKLIYIASKQGLQGLAGMQGTTFTIFDTVNLTTNTIPQTLDFFSNAQGKSQNFTNFQNGTLTAGEALIMEEIVFFLVTMSGTNLTLDTTIITDITPIGSLKLGVTDAIITAPGGLKTGQMTINIGNQVVAKDVLLNELMPEFNPRTGGVSNNFISTAALPGFSSGTAGQNKIPLEAAPVLLPNLKPKVSLRLNPVGTVAANTAIMAVIGRFGSIFASKGTF